MVCGGGFFALAGFIFAVLILIQTFQLSWTERRQRRAEEKQIEVVLEDVPEIEEDAPEPVSVEKVVEVEVEPAQVEEENATPISPDSEPKKSNKTLWIILLIVFLVLCCICLLVGVFISNNQTIL